MKAVVACSKRVSAAAAIPLTGGVFVASVTACITMQMLYFYGARINLKSDFYRQTILNLLSLIG
jgi:hypothetical protein